MAQQVAADTETTSGGVAGTVSLSPAAEELVQKSDMVFIFARPPGQAGAPVAVVRKTAESWPLEFRLTDAQSMADGMRLSDHEKVVVTARISRRGDADATLRTQSLAEDLQVPRPRDARAPHHQLTRTRQAI